MEVQFECRPLEDGHFVVLTTDTEGGESSRLHTYEDFVRLASQLPRAPAMSLPPAVGGCSCKRSEATAALARDLAEYLIACVSAGNLSVRGSPLPSFLDLTIDTGDDNAPGSGSGPGTGSLGRASSTAGRTSTISGASLRSGSSASYRAVSARRSARLSVRGPGGLAPGGVPVPVRASMRMPASSSSSLNMSGPRPAVPLAVPSSAAHETGYQRAALVGSPPGRGAAAVPATATGGSALSAGLARSPPSGARPAGRLSTRQGPVAAQPSVQASDGGQALRVDDVAVTAGRSYSSQDEALLRSRLEQDALADERRERLTRGEIFRKHGRQGKPHERRVFVTADKQYVCWGEPGKPDSKAERIAIAELTAVHPGMRTAVFARVKSGREELSDFCFSLVFGTSRTLDLQTTSSVLRDEWMNMFIDCLVAVQERRAIW